MARRFPDANVSYVVEDFTNPLGLGDLAGIVMANSLHYVREKVPVLRLVSTYLRPGGRLVVVEYNADRGNWWVPHPFSFKTWERLAADSGLTSTRLLERVPSRFLREIYSAVSVKP